MLTPLVRWWRRWTVASRILDRHGFVLDSTLDSGIKRYHLRRSDRRLVVLLVPSPLEAVGQVYLMLEWGIHAHVIWFNSLHELELAVTYQLLRPVAKGDVT